MEIILRANIRVRKFLVRDMLLSCLLMTQQLQPTPRKNSSRWTASHRPVIKSFRLTISLKKTDVLAEDTEAAPVINIDYYELDAVCQFTYVGSTITNSLSLDADIEKRIGKAASTLACITAQVWTSPKLSVKTRMAATMPVLPAHCCKAARHGLHICRAGQISKAQRIPPEKLPP